MSDKRSGDIRAVKAATHYYPLSPILFAVETAEKDITDLICL